jgi:hypothetical protein
MNQDKCGPAWDLPVPVMLQVLDHAIDTLISNKEAPEQKGRM